MDKSCVHTVPRGSTYNPTTGELSDAQGNHLDTFTKCPYPRIPYKKASDTNCLQAAGQAAGPHGGHLNMVKKCSASDASILLPDGTSSGYEARDGQSVPSPYRYTYLSAVVTVPSAPTLSGLDETPIILLFPGLEPTDRSYIFQTEIAWDSRTQSWGMYDEYNSDAVDFKDNDPSIPINPGDNIAMTLESTGTGVPQPGYITWIYGEYDEATGQSTNSLTINTDNPPTWAVGAALEITGVPPTPTSLTNCMQLPSNGYVWFNYIELGDDEFGAGEIGSQGYNNVPYSPTPEVLSNDCSFSIGSCWGCFVSGGVSLIQWSTQ